MEINETAELLATITAIYPNFKITDDAITLKAWHMMLKGYSKGDVTLALESFVKSKDTAFPPSVSELIAAINKPRDYGFMSDGEAWQLVRRAIGRGSYHSEEDFAAFPSDEIRRAVGSPNQLRAWALDENFNEGVESSNFYKRYNAAVQQAKEIQKMPAAMRLKVQQAKEIYLEAKND